MKILEDDTQGPLTSPIADVRETLAWAATHKIVREDGYVWASRRLKVLVFDDESGSDDGGKGKNKISYDPDDPEDMERFAIAMSLMSDDDSASDGEADDDLQPRAEEPPPREGKKGRFEEYVASCSRCNRFPEFPKDRKVRNFKLVQPWELCGREPPTCDHFLAVSYCWSTYAASPRHCRIRDCTTTNGQNGISYLPSDLRVPPDEVLDEAVRHASDMGLRCIWIDQACLPQDQSKEHQTGVQAMDFVYQRAAWTLGLLDSTVQSQEQLVALRVLQAWAENTRKWRSWSDSGWWDEYHAKLASILPWMSSFGDMKVRPGDVDAAIDTWSRHILGFLELISNDRWYTRAWVFQESLSSGQDITIFLRADDSLKLPFAEDEDPEAWGLVPGREQEPQGVRLSYVAVQNLIFDARYFIQQTEDLRPRSSSDVVSIQTRQHGNSSINWPSDYPHRFRDVLSRMQVLHAPSGKKFFNISNSEQSNFGPRLTLSAAAAISFLRTRQCLCPEDRIAIVANLCNYEIRLSTFELSTSIKSLRVCLFALSLFNGDFSLLTPDYYNLNELQEPAPSPIENVPSFMSGVFERLHTISVFTMDSYSLAHMRIPNLQKFVPTLGLIPGLMWSVDRKVDLSYIKRKWHKEWWSNLCICINTSLRGKGDRTADECHQQMHEYFSDPERKEKITQVIKAKSESQETALIYLDKDEDENGVFRDVQLSLTLVPSAKEEYMQSLAWMIFDTLQYLYCIGENNLADSIWQSWRVPVVDWRDEVLPDRVGPVLFTHSRVVSEPWKTLRFSLIGNGEYAQQWLLDRIMLKGYLWVGRYCATNIIGDGRRSLSPGVFFSNDLTRPRRVSNAPAMSPMDSSWFVNAVQRSIDPQLPLQRSLASWASKTMSHGDSTIVERQMLKQIIASGLRSQFSSGKDSSSDTEDHVRIGFSVGTMTHIFYMDRYFGWKFEDQESRWALCAAAFDVDEPCQVMSPYDADRERIPQPEERLMRICWIVENLSTPGGGEGHEASDEPPQYRMLNRVKGVWRVMEPAPFQCYPIV